MSLRRSRTAQLVMRRAVQCVKVASKPEGLGIEVRALAALLPWVLVRGRERRRGDGDVCRGVVSHLSAEPLPRFLRSASSRLCTGATMTSWSSTSCCSTSSPTAWCQPSHPRGCWEVQRACWRWGRGSVWEFLAPGWQQGCSASPSVIRGHSCALAPRPGVGMATSAGTLDLRECSAW